MTWKTVLYKSLKNLSWQCHAYFPLGVETSKISSETPFGCLQEKYSSVVWMIPQMVLIFHHQYFYVNLKDLLIRVKHGQFFKEIQNLFFDMAVCLSE